MCVLILQAEVLDRSMGLLGPIRLTQQPNKDVQSVAVTIFCAAAKRHLHPLLAKRSVEPPTRMDIRQSEFREFREPPRTGEQIHVPQMVVVHVVIDGVALSVGAYQRDGRIPIPDPFRCPGLLEPFHRTSIA